MLNIYGPLFIIEAIENTMGNRNIDVAKHFFIYRHRRVPGVVVYRPYFGEGGGSKMRHRRVPAVVVYEPHFGEGGGSKNFQHSPTWSIYFNIAYNKNEIHESW